MGEGRQGTRDQVGGGKGRRGEGAVAWAVSADDCFLTARVDPPGQRNGVTEMPPSSGVHVDGCSGLISEPRPQPSSQLAPSPSWRKLKPEMMQRGPGGPALLPEAQYKAQWTGGPLLTNQTM